MTEEMSKKDNEPRVAKDSSQKEESEGYRTKIERLKLARQMHNFGISSIGPGRKIW